MKIPTYKTDETECQFVDKLKIKGYFRLTGGSWSDVYASQTSKVICKVCVASSKGYRTFLQNVIEHQDNLHLPKIYACGIFKPKRGHAYLVVYMERLTETREIRKTKIKAWEKQHNLNGVGDVFNHPEDVVRLAKTKELKEVGIILDKLYQKYESDMFDFNLMWRTENLKKPELVIIDPVWD